MYYVLFGDIDFTQGHDIKMGLVCGAWKEAPAGQSKARGDQDYPKCVIGSETDRRSGAFWLTITVITQQRYFQAIFQ